MYKDRQRLSTSSHYPEVAPKYAAYKQRHLAHLEPESEVHLIYALLSWVHVPWVSTEEAGFMYYIAFSLKEAIKTL